MGHAYTFNSGFGLYDAEGNAVKEPIGKETFDISPGTYWPTRGLTVVFGKGLTDGTYYIRSISRKDGTQDWLHTVNFNTTFIKVVIDGTKAQLTVFPHTDITVQNLTLEGSGTVGVEQKVKATMTNNSETEYYHNTFLLVDGNFVSGNCIQIPALSTRDIYFKYKPESAGQHTLQVSTSKNASDAFYTTTVNVKAAVTNNLKVANPFSLLKTYNVNNKSSIYGNVMKLGVKVTNEGNDTYYSYVEASPWELDGNVYWKRGSYKQTIKLEPGESTTLTFTLPNLNLGSTYNFHIDTDKSNSSNLGNFTFVQGIDYWTADGAANAAPTKGFKVTPDMVADFMDLAFTLAFRYRNPAMILSDGVIGQMMEKVVLPPQKPRRTEEEIKQECPWASIGRTPDRAPNIITSLELKPEVMELRNQHLQKKYATIKEKEVRYEAIQLDDDTDIMIVAFGSAARIAEKAIEIAREQGIKAGLFRPITLWPFPEKEIAQAVHGKRGVLVVEINAGQMIEDVRLAVNGEVTVEHFGRLGGIVPEPEEIVNAIKEKLL